MKVTKRFNSKSDIVLFKGDCLKSLKKIPNEYVDLIITSPPYCIGKAYEDPDDDIETFRNIHEEMFPELYRILKPGGSICWQVGYHVFTTSIIPLDYIVYDVFSQKTKDIPLLLKNRIVWTFGHGLNSEKRLSGRHEVILWFTKGKDYHFNLDSIRVPQKYPGKRSYKGKNKGELSGNALGKNPSDVWEGITDVWDIPNVKANHVEKTIHPCQFPVVIPRRLIRGLSPVGGVVLDPFMGSGTTGVAAVLENRKFIGAEIHEDYYNVCYSRIDDAIKGTIKVRDDKPVYNPDPNSTVAKLPEEFEKIRKEILSGKN